MNAFRPALGFLWSRLIDHPLTLHKFRIIVNEKPDSFCNHHGLTHLTPTTQNNSPNTSKPFHIFNHGQRQRPCSESRRPTTEARKAESPQERFAPNLTLAFPRLYYFLQSYSLTSPLPTGKAAVAAQRTERYASRNPRRLESTISDLHALKESQGGKLSSRDQRQLEEAERDVARVKKAREVLGDKAPTFNSNRGGGEARGRGDGRGRRGDYGGLGKRNREEQESSGEETDESVRRIPWPRDTPPPIPRQRRDDRPRHSTNANSEPLGADRRLQDREGAAAKVPDTTLPSKPAPKTTYESKPVVRDLRKEATARFVPNAVKRKIDATKGVGAKLLEEDEVEKLEKEGYGTGGRRLEDGVVGRGLIVDAAPEVGGGDPGYERERKRLEEEEERFRKEMEEVEADAEGDGPKRVMVEEISDEEL